MNTKTLPSRLGKGLLIVAGALLALVAVALLVLNLVYPWQYVYRMLAWRESDVNDYRYNFPQSTLTAAAAPSPFDEAPDPARVAAVFEQQPGMDDLDEFLAASQTQALIVIQDGAVVYENYFNGARRDTPVTSFSVAKSWVSALVGIAIDEGAIDDVNDPITDYLPELAERDPRFENITIRHLLLMASGLDFQEMRLFLFNGDDPLATYYPDQRELVLENTQIAGPPEATFRYNKYHPQLLGMILERATGVSVTEYMQRTLWEPLGMEFDGGWSLDSEASGFEKMEAGLNGRAIDFAKFGQLFLNGGDWHGAQVISPQWVAESTGLDPALHTASHYPDEFGRAIYKDGQGYYQYMWYGFLRDDGSHDFAAAGDHGQFIYVSPSKNLVIVRHGVEYGIPGSPLGWMDAFYQFASDF